MASIYNSRRMASGNSRRSFRGGVYREELDAHGQVKKVRVPAAYWKQPEDAIPLAGLKEYWEHNNTQFTPEWHRAFNQRLRHDYLDICMTYDPEVCAEPRGATNEEFLKKQEAFFDQVAELDKWPFWKYTKQTKFREFYGTGGNTGIVSAETKDYFGLYDDYLDYRGYRFRAGSRGREYGEYRRTLLARDKAPGNPYQISGQNGYQYRDEDEQLGDMTLEQPMAEKSEYKQISIYAYLSPGNLVPRVGMPDLDAMRREYEDRTGVRVPDEELVSAAAKRAAELETAAKRAAEAEKMAAKRADEPVAKPEPAKPGRDISDMPETPVQPGGLQPGRDMSDLNRLVAEFDTSKDGDISYGG